MKDQNIVRINKERIAGYGEVKLILYEERPAVVVESPYAGEIEDNIKYAQECITDCFARGEAPFASHLIYPQVLKDADPKHRTLGITAGFIIGKGCDKTVVYIDRGVTLGMVQGMLEALDCGRTIEIRSLRNKS